MVGEKQNVCATLHWAMIILAIVIASTVMTLVRAEDVIDLSTQGKSTERRMVFYMHDIPRSPHPTVALVAKSLSNNLTNSGLGLTMIFDDKLTEGPDPKSREIGRGQGMYSVASLSRVDLLMVFTAVFHYPPHLNGSTLSLHGSDRTALVTREIAIVGGTGVFRFARGVASISTISNDGANAILKFDLTLIL